jgi:hypothetical protein
MAGWVLATYTRHNLCYGALKGGRRPLILMPRRTQPLPLEMTAMSAPTANDQFGFSLGDPPISIQRTITDSQLSDIGLSRADLAMVFDPAFAARGSNHAAY